MSEQYHTLHLMPLHNNTVFQMFPSSPHFPHKPYDVVKYFYHSSVC